MLSDASQALPATVAIGDLEFQRTTQIAEDAKAVAVSFETRNDVRIRASPDRHDKGAIDAPFFQLVEDRLELLHLRETIGFHMRNRPRFVVPQAVILAVLVLQKVTHPQIVIG